MTTPVKRHPDTPQRVVDSAAAGNNNDDQLPKLFSPSTCQSCVRRKVRCDRVLPVCSSCSKAKFECQYHAPPPTRATKRRRGTTDSDGSQELRDRLKRYERALQENGLLHAANIGASSAPVIGRLQNDREQGVATVPTISAVEGYVQKPVLQPKETTQAPCYGDVVGTKSHPQVEGTKSGKLLAADGKSRYISSQIWLDAGDADMAEMSEHDQDQEEQPEQKHTPVTGLHSVVQDPLSGALLGISQDMLGFHPVPDHAPQLWAIHVSNVEPLCKVLHIPTTARLIETVSQRPATATKAQECLLFSIYHFAIFSLDNAECQLNFGQPRSALLEKYEYATRQALVNASWLKTTDLSVLQACVLFLIAMRGRVDPHTFWILTGVAVRIAQRMGLHRDGESLGLSPYDVELRRRLFWQLVPLDSYAGQISGTGISITPNSWDTKQPLNINDDQIYPGMVTRPEEQNRSSDMLFCRTRAELSNFYARTGVKAKQIGPTIDFRENAELDKLIDETEGIIEAKYLRYCDILNPLHVFTLGVVRAAANTVRLRNRIAPLMNQTISDGRRRELCILARKILDTDNALYRDPNMKGFRWQIKTHYLWDSLICVLMSLAKPGFFSAVELNATWSMLAELYSNHPEIIEGKRAIQASIGKATLVAWRARPRPSHPAPATPHGDDEPAFILRLRQLQRRRNAKDRPSRGQDEGAGTTDTTAPLTPGNVDGGAEVIASLGALLGNLDGAELDFDGDFYMNPADWMMWNQFSQPEGTDFT
ncbi:hypothetical protein SLS53_000259 [Cytospora paraplurivora]|uniref:Zn(2)-C6 fungal-type domain-containing protein n=1 Tax=Cytospora paraplurivora TaxID=2898453 RepID=A0AAN9UNS0_9PEZI